MTAPLYFRASVKRDPALDTLGPILMPADTSARLQTDHRLMWSLFAGAPDATRDFLFRREGRGATFLILSQRPPSEPSPLFDVESKVFAPDLAPGDHLCSSLLAINRRHREGARKVTRRHDVVMDALAKMPPGARAQAR